MMPRDFRNSSAAGALRAVSFGKWISRKLPTLGVTLSPSFSISAVSHGSQRLVVGDGRLDVRAVLERRHAGRERRRETLNGPRMRLSTSATAAGQ